MVHENRRVMQVLTDAVSVLPAILGVVMLASIVVSLDKTAAAFHAAVANKDALWGAWAAVVAIAGVVMADAALVVAEFALVRDQLKKALPRQVWTVKSLVRSVKVRLGMTEPLNYHQMQDPTLKFYSQFVFWLVIAANVYAVTRAGNVHSLGDVNFETGLLLFVGIAGALSLRFIGQQLAHTVYELVAERKRVEAHDLYDAWRQEMNALWEAEGPRLVQEALHERFIRKNKLPPGVPSPYVLMASEEDGALDAVPLALSQPSLEPPSPNGSKPPMST